MDDDLFNQIRSQARREIRERIDNNLRYGAEVSGALDKILVTLSGGALVFSMAFAEKLAPGKLWLPCLFISWIAFALSIIGVAFALKTLQNELSNNATKLNALSEEIETRLAKGELPALVAGTTPGLKILRWNQIALWSFITGILLLGAFVSRNLIAS